MQKLIVFIGSFFALFPLVFATVQVQAFDAFEDICAEDPNATVCQEAAKGESEDPLTGNDSIINTIANVVALITAVIAVIIIIVAGITMTLSGGDSAKIQSSRNAIIYAAIGLVVVALARTVVIFVVDRI